MYVLASGMLRLSNAYYASERATALHCVLRPEVTRNATDYLSLTGVLMSDGSIMAAIIVAHHTFLFEF